MRRFVQFLFILTILCLFCACGFIPKNNNSDLPKDEVIIETNANQDAQIVDSGVCGDDLKWELFDNGNLRIFGIGDMYNRVGTINHVFWDLGVNSAEIRKVIIEDGVTSIGESAFYRCDTLLEVVMPDSVTRIGPSAFYSCGNLASVRFSKGLISIENGAFQGCDNLSFVLLPNSVTTIGRGAFYGCGLTDILLPRNLVSIEDGAFMYCDMETVILPESLSYLGDEVFSSCNELTEIRFTGDAPKFGEKYLYYAGNFDGLTVYYPSDNETWTKDFIAFLTDYHGSWIEWKPYSE